MDNNINMSTILVDGLKTAVENVKSHFVHSYSLPDEMGFDVDKIKACQLIEHSLLDVKITSLDVEKVKQLLREMKSCQRVYDTQVENGVYQLHLMFRDCMSKTISLSTNKFLGNLVPNTGKIYSYWYYLEGRFVAEELKKLTEN